MDTSEKVRENRVRRMLKRQGYSLMKSRRRDPQALDYGGYMIIDDEINGVVFGSNPYEFSATLDNVEDWFKALSDEE